MENIVVCLSSYYKGYDFMVETKALGNKVILVTSDNLKDKPWPWEAIDEVYYMPEIAHSKWNMDHLVKGFAHLMKTNRIDAVIALDDYDVGKAAMLREVFRIPGMGQTTFRYFRDKLAMRQKAKDSGISIPEFSAVFNNDVVHEFVQAHPGPWVLKPRSEASASGIIKVNSEEELWPALDKLGDERHMFLLESFKPGDVYHVDCLVYQKEIVFVNCSKYLAPPMQVSHKGGVFRTISLEPGCEEDSALREINAQVLGSFGIVNGGTHSEYIRGEDGKYYFLETAARIGGAHIPDMVEAATGVNIWKEWAKLEVAIVRNEKYEVSEARHVAAGLIIALSKEKHPDTTPFECEEVDKFINLDYHIGIVYKSEDYQKVRTRMDDATTVITRDVLNIVPPQDKPKS